MTNRLSVTKGLKNQVELAREWLTDKYGGLDDREVVMIAAKQKLFEEVRKAKEEYAATKKTNPKQKEAPVVNHRYTAHQPSVYDVAPTIEVWRGEILMPRLLSG